jgi:hypothetical protein
MIADGQPNRYWYNIGIHNLGIFLARPKILKNIT